MSRKFRRRRAGLVITAAALASLGGLDAVLMTPHGGARPEVPIVAAAQMAAIASSRPTVGPPQASSPAAPRVSGATAPAVPRVVEKPPPVVDGVRRVDVGSAHSPRLLQQLASAPATMPPPAEAGAEGVDVADYQHPHGAAINWPHVAAAGYKFAFIKATEGDYYANPYYASDLAQAKAAGLYATGYHFAIPNVSGGASQAYYAVANGSYAADGHTLPLALDIEYNPYGSECYGLSAAQMVSWITDFTAEAQRLTGQRPIIYTTADWWGTCTGNSAAFGSDPLWIAAYRSGGPPMPAGWGNWTFWQYTSNASVPGIAGSVDVSYFLQAAVRLLDPGSQLSPAGRPVQVQVSSLNAAGGEPLQYDASDLPPGLSIGSSGLISGTISATAAGTYQVAVAARSASGGTGSVSFLWTVTAGQGPALSEPSTLSLPSTVSQPSPPLTQPTPAPTSPYLLPSDSPSPSDPAATTPSDPASSSGSTPASPSGSPSPSDSASPSPTDSACASPSDSASSSSSASATPSPSPSVSPCASPSDSAVPAGVTPPAGAPSDSPSASGCSCS